MPPRKKPATPPAALEYTKMLFLAGHGLQSPLSAIRWGCGRLKRSADNLTDEQKSLLEDVQSEAKLLSDMFDSLLLVAKVSEGVQEPSIQEIILRDFLMAAVAREQIGGKIAMRVICPDNLRIRADRPLFETAVSAVLLAAAVSADGTSADVTAGSDGERCIITVTTPMKLTLLQESGNEGRNIVGGVAGFLLAVASTLAPKIGGELEPVRDGESVRGLALKVPLMHA